VFRLLDQLGLLKTQLVPVQLIPARDQSIIRIGTLKDHETPLSVVQIESCFAEPGAVIPPQLTSHFQVSFRDGTWDRVREGQPDVVIAKADFLDLNRLEVLARQAQTHHLALGEATLKQLGSSQLPLDALEEILAAEA
jgi:hypothetical protein